MANGNRKKSFVVPLAVGAAAAAAAGCGSSNSGPDPDVLALSRLTPVQHHDRPGAIDLDPEVTGRELMRLKRVGAQFGTSDLVKYGSDGSVVVMMFYGGGGEKISRCTLRDGELARLRANLATLPLDKPEPAPEPPRTDFYAKPPTQYTLQAGRRVQTFTENEMPRRARPFVRRLVATLSGHVARCRVTYRTPA